MKIHSKAVHSGDRKRIPGRPIPVTTPIHTAASFFYDSLESIDKVFAKELEGYAYSRYDNPSNAALEQLVSDLEGAHGSLATASGMSALQIAITAALVDRRKHVLAANALYGATVKLLQQVFEPFGTTSSFVDITNLDAVAAAIENEKPGVILMESISNPLLRVGQIDRIAELANAAGACLIVDNTFATPALVRPLELGAHISLSSATKYLSGHGDVIGGIVSCDAAHFEPVRALSRIYGPILGPFECYLTMRGIKTFPLRFERQNQNAIHVARHLLTHPAVEAVYFPGLDHHPDRETTARLLPAGQFGAMVSFEIRDADRQAVFAFFDRLRMIVPATSLGDVHTMALYPAIASHRDIPPRQRARLGIRDNLVRLSVGIEDISDILADLDQALAAS
jgi:cystathionine beta-lyase/cystathionine gamma-synthase